MWYELTWSKTIDLSRPTFSTSKLFSRPEFLRMMFPSGFSLPFSLFHATTRWYRRNQKSVYQRGWSYQCSLYVSQIFCPTPLFHPNTIPVPLSRMAICGLVLPMVLDEFIKMLLFMFRPIWILILSQTFWLPKENYWSPCPHLSMEALAWLLWLSVSSKQAIIIVRYSEPIVIDNNDIFYIPARLVFSNWSNINCWVVYLPRVVDSSSRDGIFLR